MTTVGDGAVAPSPVAEGVAKVRSFGDVLTQILVVLCAAGAAYVCVLEPSLAKVLVAALALLVVAVVHPQWWIYLVVVFAFTSFPASLHIARDFGVFTLLPYEVSAVFAIVVLSRKKLNIRPADVLPGIVFLGLILVACMHGSENGNDVFRNARDTQFLLDTVLGYFFALLAIRAGYLRRLAIVSIVVLWVSAGLITVAMATGLEIAGREDELTTENAATEGVRFITQTQMPAAAILFLAAAMVILRITQKKFLWLALPPALYISFLGFSRNTLVGLGVAIVACVVFGPSARRLVRAVGLVVGLLAAGVILVPIVQFLASGTSVGTTIDQQVTNFKLRVVSGLSSEYLARDPSYQARLLEDADLHKAIAESPWVGHGMGYAYRFHFDVSPNFTPPIEASYAHNFYYWLLTKAGILGVLALAVFVGVPLIRALRNHSPASIASASIVAAFLVICIVAPLPLDPGNALLFGIAIGVMSACARPLRSDPPGPSYRASADSGDERSAKPSRKVTDLVS